MPLKYQAEINDLLVGNNELFSQLLLGVVPDESTTQRLRVILRAIYRETENHNSLDREVAHFCATILHIAHLCAFHARDETFSKVVVDISRDLALSAHEILVGSRLDYKIAIRHDLEYCTHDSNGDCKWHPRE